MPDIKCILVVHMGKEVTRRSFIISQPPKTVKEATELLRSRDLRLEATTFEYTVHSLQVNKGKCVKFTKNADLATFFSNKPQEVIFDVVLQGSSNVSAALSPDFTDTELVKLLIFPPLDSNSSNSEAQVVEKMLVIPPVDVIPALKRSIKSTMNLLPLAIVKIDFSLFFVSSKDGEKGNEGTGTMPIGPITDNSFAREWLVKHAKAGRACKLTYKILNQAKPTAPTNAAQWGATEKGSPQPNEKSPRNANSNTNKAEKKEESLDAVVDVSGGVGKECEDSSLATASSISSSSTGKPIYHMITVLVLNSSGDSNKVSFPFCKTSPSVLDDFRRTIATSLSLTMPVGLVVRSGEGDFALDNVGQLREWVALSKEAGQPLCIRVSPNVLPTGEKTPPPLPPCAYEKRESTLETTKTHDILGDGADRPNDGEGKLCPNAAVSTVSASIETSDSPRYVRQTHKPDLDIKVSGSDRPAFGKVGEQSPIDGASSTVSVDMEVALQRGTEKLLQCSSQTLRTEAPVTQAPSGQHENLPPKPLSSPTSSFINACLTSSLLSPGFPDTPQEESANEANGQKRLRKGDEVEKVSVIEFSRRTSEHTEGGEESKASNTSQRPGSNTTYQQSPHPPAAAPMLTSIDSTNSLLQSVFHWRGQEQIILFRLCHSSTLEDLKKCICEAFHMRPISSTTSAEPSTRGHSDMKLFIMNSTCGSNKTQHVEIASERDIWKEYSASLSLPNAIWEVQTSDMGTPAGPQQVNEGNFNEIPLSHDSIVHKEADTVSLLSFLAKSIRTLLGASFTNAQLMNLLCLCDDDVDELDADAAAKRSDVLLLLEKNSSEVINDPLDLSKKLCVYFGADGDNKKAQKGVQARLSHACAVVYAKKLATPSTALRSFFLEISEFVVRPIEDSFEADALVEKLLQYGKEKQLPQPTELPCPHAGTSVARSEFTKSNEAFAKECVKQFEREPTELLNGLVLWALQENMFSYLCADTAYTRVGGGVGNRVVIPFQDKLFRKWLTKILQGRLQCYLECNTDVTRQNMEVFVQQCVKSPGSSACDDLLDVLGALLASKCVTDYAQWFKTHFRGKFSQILYTQMLVFTCAESLPTYSLYKACWKILNPELDPVLLTEKYSSVAGALARWAFTALQLQCLHKGFLCFPPFPAFDIPLGAAGSLAQGLVPCCSALTLQQDFAASAVDFKTSGGLFSQTRQLSDVNSIGDAKRDGVRRKRIWYRYIYSTEDRKSNSITD